MPNKRITELTAITTLASTDVFHVGQTSTDKKITAPNAKAYILQYKTIGGTAATDITTGNSTQTLTNKTLTSPKINSTTAVTSTSAQINLLHGATVTTAQINKLTGLTVGSTQLNRLDGIVANVQTSLDNKFDRYSTAAYYPVMVPIRFTASGTTKTISSADVLSVLGLSGTSYAINGKAFTVGLAQVASSTRVIPQFPVTDVTTAANGSGTKVTNIQLQSLTNGYVYDATITFLLAGVTGA